MSEFVSWIRARFDAFRTLSLPVRTAVTVVAMLAGSAVPVAVLSVVAVGATSAAFPDRNATAEERLDSPTAAGEAGPSEEGASAPKKAPAKGGSKPAKGKRSAPSSR
jgi:hypothetical protein